MAKVRCFACLGYRFMGASFCFVCLGAGQVDHDAICDLGCGRVAVKTVNGKHICFSTMCFEKAKNAQTVLTYPSMYDDGYDGFLTGTGNTMML